MKKDDDDDDDDARDGEEKWKKIKAKKIGKNVLNT